MDWSRVKTILIIALLITNAIIVLFIALDDDSANLTDVANQTALLDKILLEKKIDNQIGEDTPQVTAMPQVVITYQQYNMAELATALLGKYSKQNGIYYSADYQISFAQNKLSIKRLSVEESAINSSQSAEQVAADFIKRYLNAADDYKLIFNDGTNLKYIQQYQGYPIYDTSMQIVVENDQVVSLQRKWMTVVPKDDGQQAVKAYHRALFSAVDQLDELAPITIKSVALGYRLEKTLLGENVQSGDALPYYQFSLSDGQQLFVPALLQNYSEDTTPQ